MVSKSNVRDRFNTDEETWPPDQPKNFIPLVLIHHQGKHNMKQATAMTRLIERGDIDEITFSLTTNSLVSKQHPSNQPLQEVFDSSTVTKELTEILAPLDQSENPQFILIEGAPGIGKSILLKEIAYRWGNKQLLKTFKLVLLVPLRDPTVQQVVSVSDLFQLFCNREDTRTKQISTACSDYLVQNNGKDLVFLFDGFDEYPEVLQKNGLIADMLKRKVLPECTLVVSSRPHATVYLRGQATVRVDILGFTKVEQNQFIQQALKEQPESIKKLAQYLENHCTISSLCVVPFHMVILLFLYKQGISLPNNSAELYNYFIRLTICRHLAKHGHVLNNTITDFTTLPDSCKKIIRQLSKFSLDALNNNKFVFTFEEIKLACPDIIDVPGAINGFGLLQAVQHHGITGNTMTFNFLHFTVQEFLAAYHITCLLPNEELKILKEKFWSETHSNMFAIYVTLTHGQRPSFRQFIKPSLGQRVKEAVRHNKEISISHQCLDTHLKCLNLYRCFHELDDKEICKCIENAKVFQSKIFSIAYTQLSPSDVECMTVFLSCSSHKEWSKINLYGCYIQDRGVHILHHGLTSREDVTITKLWLNSNGLTEFSSTAISDITINCRVKELRISDNSTIGKDEWLSSIISDPSSMLEVLHMYSTKLSSSVAVKIFTALSEHNTLRILRIHNNDITDEACDAIVMAMKKNTSLVELRMDGNPISGECAQLIVEAIQHNNTLQLLSLPFNYPHHVKEKIGLSVEEINKNRESRECKVKLELHFW